MVTRQSAGRHAPIFGASLFGGRGSEFCKLYSGSHGLHDSWHQGVGELTSGTAIHEGVAKIVPTSGTHACTLRDCVLAGNEGFQHGQCPDMSVSFAQFPALPTTWRSSEDPGARHRQSGQAGGKGLSTLCNPITSYRRGDSVKDLSSGTRC